MKLIRLPYFQLFGMVNECNFKDKFSVWFAAVPEITHAHCLTTPRLQSQTNLVGKAVQLNISPC